MAIGFTFFVLALVIIAIWVLVEVKRLRHKVFALFLIGLILFSYISFSLVLKDKEVDLNTIPGFVRAGKLYLVWLGSVFGNLKQITMQAVGMEWSPNKSIEDQDSEVFGYDLENLEKQNP